MNRAAILIPTTGAPLVRRVTDALITNYPNYACTGAYTANYRLRDQKDHEFFIKGGARMAREFPGGFPWAKKKEAAKP